MEKTPEINVTLEMLEQAAKVLVYAAADSNGNIDLTIKDVTIKGENVGSYAVTCKKI